MDVREGHKVVQDHSGLFVTEKFPCRWLSDVGSNEYADANTRTRCTYVSQDGNLHNERVADVAQGLHDFLDWSVSA